jgi:protein-S-isoprenylcysteine O-methyltransferase Ste14
LGIFLKDPSLLSGALLGLAWISLYAAARVEERENLGRFGQVYAAYMQSTRMFIPWIF